MAQTMGSDGEVKFVPRDADDAVHAGAAARARSLVRDTFKADSKLAKLLPSPLEVTHHEGNPQEPEPIRALATHFRDPDEP